MRERPETLPSNAHRMQAILEKFPRGATLSTTEVWALIREEYPDQQANIASSLTRLVTHGHVRRLPGQPARWYRP
jgi:hypothetical protein